MKRDAHNLQTLARCLKLNCPVCGRASIVRRPFNLKHSCESCRAVFKREEGSLSAQLWRTSWPLKSSFWWFISRA
jgi:uncharacterized protein (DUF983 family)